MFEYSTETIINSNVGNLAGGKRFNVANGYLLIDGVNALKISDIAAIYRTGYRAAVKEVEEVVIPASLGNKIVRLAVTIKEVGRVSSPMMNAYLRHTKPFFFEVQGAAAAADTVAALVAAINKEMAATDFPFFKASIKSGATNTLVLTADDCHVRFVEVRVDEPSAAASGSGEKLLGFHDYAAIAGVTVTKATAGDCGAGTVEHIIKDLRIPTNASINPFAADHGGMPVPGGKYDQYVIELEVSRRNVGHSVMGSISKSITSHVFFIESAALADWKTAMTSTGKSVTLAGKAGDNVDATGLASLSSGVVTAVKSDMGSVE